MEDTTNVVQAINIFTLSCEKYRGKKFYDVCF